MTRFEIFNEMLFESYCKKSVGNAIKKEREKKAARGKLELTFFALTDAVLYPLCLHGCRRHGLQRGTRPRNADLWRPSTEAGRRR